MRKTVYGKGRGELDPRELEAKRFAFDSLIPAAAFEKLIASGVFTDSAIGEFADEIGVAPGIVVGRLHHAGVIGCNFGNALKIRYKWMDGSEDG